MATILRGTVVAVLLSCLASGSAHAATQTILGKKIQVKDPMPGDATKRRVTGSGQERGSTNTIAGDPTASGATLEVITNGGTDSDQTFDLPSSGWSRVSSLGFKWSNRDQPLNPVKRAGIKKTPSGTFQLKIDINAHGGAVAVVPPNPGTSGGFILKITGGDTYCVGFGGAAGGVVLADDARQWAVKSPAMEACPAPNGAMSTSSTSTTTMTVTSTTTTTATTSTTSTTASTVATTTSTTTTAPSTTTTSETTSTLTTTTTTSTTVATATSTTTTTTVPPRSCEAINNEYRLAVEEAKACTITGQCVVQRDASLFCGCCCPCPTFVNPTNTAALAVADARQAEWDEEGCCGGIDCAASSDFCRQPPVVAVCSTGRCDDL